MKSRFFILQVDTGFYNCSHTEELEMTKEMMKGLSEEEIQSLASEIAVQFMYENIDVSAHEKESNE